MLILLWPVFIEDSPEPSELFGRQLLVLQEIRNQRDQRTSSQLSGE